MSTFPGTLAEIADISIDRFDGNNLASSVFFLSHCHLDHMVGLDSDEFISCLENGDEKYIYMSKISSIILKNRIPALKNYIKPLDVLESHSIPLPKQSIFNDEMNFLEVILIPAAHCPGSVMFLFQMSDNSRILYTGDFRLSPEVLPKIKELNNVDGTPKIINKIYFDSTFWDEKHSDFPNRDASSDAICDIINSWISKGKDYMVSLNIPALYGSEFLYMDIYKRLNIPIHVSDDVYKVYSRIADMDGSITRDPEITQIHCCGNRSRPLTCRKSIYKIKLRYIRPTAMRWHYFNLKTSEIFTKSTNESTFYVCSSSHSSLNELKGFINYFKPQEIEPCVVPSKETAEFYSSIYNFRDSYLDSSFKFDEIDRIHSSYSDSDCDEKFSKPLEGKAQNGFKLKNKIKPQPTTIILDSSSESEEDKCKKHELSTLGKLIEARRISTKYLIPRKKNKLF